MSDAVMVPREPTEAMLTAARGLIMARDLQAPNGETTLGDVARSGFYGEHWRDILTDEERAIASPLSKGHFAQLIYRAMLAASTPIGGWETIDALPEAMKDGVTRFLVAYTDGVVRACRWLDNSETAWPWKGVSPTEQIPMRADARMTHWMPLPPPPSVSIDNGSRPQEAVPTEQAEPAVLADVIRQNLLGVRPDDQAVVLDDDDWRLILASLDRSSASDRPRR